MKEWQTIPIRDDLHRVLKKQAVDQGKKLRDLTNEVLAEALGVKLKMVVEGKKEGHQ